MRQLLTRGKWLVGGLVVPGILASLGKTGLAALVFVAVLVLGVACWVISDEERSARAIRLIFAGRGDSRCLESDPLRSKRSASTRVVNSASGSPKVPAQRT
jgi:hypothetical protein